MKHSFLLKAFTIGALTTSIAVGTMAADIEPGEISVTGQAVRQVAPSYALLNLGVSSKIRLFNLQNHKMMRLCLSSSHPYNI